MAKDKDKDKKKNQRKEVDRDEAVKDLGKKRIKEAERKVKELEKKKQKVRERMHKYRHPKPGNKKKLKELRDKVKQLNKRRAKARRIRYETPGSPGEKTPWLEPELDEQETLDLARLNNERNNVYRDTAADYNNLYKDVLDEQRQIAQASRLRRADADNEMAARGLFQSSVRDRALLDINKEAVFNQTRLNDHLEIAKNEMERLRADADADFEYGEQTLWNSAGERAQKRNAENPEYLTKPVAAKKKKYVIPATPVKKPTHKTGPTGKPSLKPGVKVGTFHGNQFTNVAVHKMKGGGNV